MLRFSFFQLFSKAIRVILSVSLLLSPSTGYAQGVFVNTLPLPGEMLGVSPVYTPVLVNGLVVHPDTPLNFDFIVNSGNAIVDQAMIGEQSERFAKYFLALVTVPEDQLWVNLSPYERDRIIFIVLGETVLGRDMLAQDYVLKQLTASLIYPEKGLGKEFWTKIYSEAQAKFGTTDIPVDTFNKVWITPEKAEVFEKGNAVYVTQAKLKVQLDTDHLATSNHPMPTRGHFAEGKVSPSTQPTPQPLNVKAPQVSTPPPNLQAEIAKQVMREIILPAIEKEVNEGKNFTVIRQIYHAAILAKWYRALIQDTLMARIYMARNRVAGVTSDEKELKEQIYQRYIAAYKKGVFNYIKEESDGAGSAARPMKYFSGGISDLALTNTPLSYADNAAAVTPIGKQYRVMIAMHSVYDWAVNDSAQIPDVLIRVVQWHEALSTTQALDLWAGVGVAALVIGYGALDWKYIKLAILRQIPGGFAYDRVVPFLYDADKNVRNAAVDVLVRIGDKRAIALIAERFPVLAASSYFCANAIAALKRLGAGDEVIFQAVMSQQKLLYPSLKFLEERGDIRAFDRIVGQLDRKIDANRQYRENDPGISDELDTLYKLASGDAGRVNFLISHYSSVKLEYYSHEFRSINQWIKRLRRQLAVIGIVPEHPVVFGITGATGSIGTQLLRQLLASRSTQAVYVLARTKEGRVEDDALLRQKLLLDDPRVHVVQGDLQDVDKLDELVQKSDVVYHLGGWAGLNPPGKPAKSALDAVRDNVVPTVILARLAEKYSKRMVYSSTVYFYPLGVVKEGVVKENDLQLPPDVEKKVSDLLSLADAYAKRVLAGDKNAVLDIKDEYGRDLYAYTKLTGEMAVRRYWKGLALRLSNVYGPGDETIRQIPTFIRKMSENKPIQYIQGLEFFFLYYKDAIKAFVAAGRVAVAKNERVINVSPEESISQGSLLSMIKGISDSQSLLNVFTDEEIDRLNLRRALASVEYDITRMSRILGFKAVTPLEAGLAETKDWLLGSNKWDSYPMLNMKVRATPGECDQIQAEIDRIERVLSRQDDTVRKDKVREVMDGLRQGRILITHESQDVLDSTAPDAKVLGAIDANLVEKLRYIHQTSNAFVFAPDGRVILQRRVDTTSAYPLHFTIPGGHLVSGQSYEEGMRSELMEELDLQDLQGVLREVGGDVLDNENSPNRERNKLYTYVLTPAEFDSVIRNNEDLARARAARTMEEYSQYLKDLQIASHGSGEVWEYKIVELQELLLAGKKEVVLFEKDFLNRFLPVENVFKGQILLEDVPVTPDLLERAIDNPELIRKIEEQAAALKKGDPEFDAAMNGGIDIQGINVARRNGGMRIRFNDQVLREISNDNFSGFSPEVIKVTPVVNSLLLSGFEAR